MGSGDTVTVKLSGGGPWGFRLMGGGSFPIQVAKIRKKSKASLAGLQEGDNLVSINGVSLVGKSHEDAMNQVDNAGDSLTVEVQRSGETSQQTAVAEQNGTTVDAEPVVTSSTTSYSVDGDNVRTDVVSTKQEKRSAGGVETKTYTERVTRVSSDGSKPASVTQQTLQVSYSNQSDKGKENIAPTTGIFTQNKWSTVPHFNVRNMKNTLKPAVQGNQQVQQQSLSPVPTPSIFKPAFASPMPQKVRSVSPSVVMQPPASPSIMSPQMRSSPTPVMQRPVSPSIMSPQMRSSPVPTPTKFTPTYAQPPEHVFQPAPPPPPPMSQAVPDSELYFEVPKPRMPKPELPPPPMPMENEEFDILLSPELDEHHHHADHHEHLPIFAPPVEFYPEDLDFPDTPLTESLPDLEMRRVKSLESEGSVDSARALKTRRKKLYSDSAFYDDPTASYPTIREQISLCKQIAKSLTSAANRKARGARMFAKRKHKSSRWIHDGEHHDSYSAGDVEDLVDLDTEIFIDEGGSRPLFSFRIPNIRKRIANPDGNLKMSLTQDQFERLRLGSQKSDHRAVSPSTCHSLVADLQSKKNRGAKLFQKRQARSEKWVIDESNAKKVPMSPPTRLETMLSPSSEPGLSPWEAAMQNPIGSVDAAFSTRHRQEQLKKYNKPFPQPVSVPYQQQQQQQQPVVKHNLRAEEQLNVITGPTYNRSPRGWGAQEDVVDTRSLDRKTMRSQQRTSNEVQAAPPPPPPPPKPSRQQDNYNRKIKAWGCRDDDGVQSSWSTTQNVQYEPYGGGRGEPQGYRMSNTYNYQMSSVQQPQPMMLPGSDL